MSRNKRVEDIIVIVYYKQDVGTWVVRIKQGENTMFLKSAKKPEILTDNEYVERELRYHE